MINFRPVYPLRLPERQSLSRCVLYPIGYSMNSWIDIAHFIRKTIESFNLQTFLIAA